MPDTRASNKFKRPGKCVLDAESDVEAKSKPKRKRRTQEEMRAAREEQARVAQEKDAILATQEKERGELLRKIAELEMKMHAEDVKKIGRRQGTKSSDSESQHAPRKKAKVPASKTPAIETTARKVGPKKRLADEFDEDEEVYEPKTPAPPRKKGKKPPYMEVGDESEGEWKTPVPYEPAGNIVGHNDTIVEEHLNFVTPVPRGARRSAMKEAPFSAPDGLSNESKVISDSQTGPPSYSPSQLLQNQTGEKAIKSSRQKIERMKLDAQRARQRDDGHGKSQPATHISESDAAEAKSSHFNRWLTDCGAPQNNTGTGSRSAGSKRSVPTSHIGGSDVTGTTLATSSSRTNVAHESDIIELEDSDEDVPAFEEDQTVERNAARSSPVKHGQRLTSKSMVKVVSSKDKVAQKPRPTVRVKQEPQDDLDVGGSVAQATKLKPKSVVKVKTEPGIVKTEAGSDVDDSTSEGEDGVKKNQKRDRATNDSLPPVVAKNKRLWRAAIVPTLLNYIASLHNPWAISEDKIIAYLQPILDHFFPRERHVIKPSDPMLGVVTQRLNEWRSSFGSTAVTALNAYFKDQQITPKGRQNFADNMLKDKAFLYFDPEKKLSDGQVRQVGIFRGRLILQTFSAHLKAVTNAVTDIPQLEYPKRAVGALALAAVAAERALKLWQKGFMETTSDGGSRPIKQLNPNTGKLSSKVHEFSSVNCAERTALYISRMVAPALSDERFMHIVAEGQALALKFRSSQVDGSTTEGSDDNFNVEFDD